MKSQAAMSTGTVAIIVVLAVIAVGAISYVLFKGEGVSPGSLTQQLTDQGSFLQATPGPTAQLNAQPGEFLPTEYGSLDGILPAAQICNVQVNYQPQVRVSGFQAYRKGTRVALSYTGRIGANDFNAQAGATAQSVNPGSGFNLILYDTNGAYFNRTAKGTLWDSIQGCVGQNAVLAEMPRVGGATVNVKRFGANASSISAANCVPMLQPGGSVVLTLELVENTSGTNYGFLTHPDSGKPFEPGAGYGYYMLSIDSNQTSTLDASLSSAGDCVSYSNTLATNNNYELVWRCKSTLQGAGSESRSITLRSPSAGNTLSFINTTVTARIHPFDYYFDTNTNAPAVGPSDTYGNVLSSARVITEAIEWCSA